MFQLATILPTPARLRRFYEASPNVLPVGSLLLLCGVFFFPGLNHGDLCRNEGLRALLGAECLRSGNWIVPMLYGEPLLTKPPGTYAAIALASWPFGQVTESSARLPSALAATATVLLVYWTFTSHLGRKAGFLAAIMLLTSLFWFDKVPAAEIDPLQVFWVTAAIGCFLRALTMHEEANGQRAWLWWQLAVLAVVGGLLTKWTAPAFFYAAVVPLLWWRRRLRLLVCWQHLLATAVGGLLALTWAGLAIHLVGWETFSSVIRKEALEHLSPAHHPRPYPWTETLLHPLVVAACCLPWTPLALATLRPGICKNWDARDQRLLQVLHCWCWPNLLFWTLAPEHSPRHSLPLFPALVGLATCGLWSLGSRLRLSGVVLAVVLLALTAKLVFVHAIVPARNQGREPRAKGQELAAQVPDSATLYLFRVKDDGLMFYYMQQREENRQQAAIRRLADPELLPSTTEGNYGILTQSEWQQWCGRGDLVTLHRMQDQQGEPIVLVRFDQRCHTITNRRDEGGDAFEAQRPGNLVRRPRSLDGQ